jgi:hypothetical protein
MNLVDLPTEIIVEIILFSDPRDVASISQSSKLLNSIIYGASDDHLWRSMYLSLGLEDPRACVNLSGEPRGQVDWKRELKGIVRAQTVLEKGLIPSSDDERCDVLRSLLALVIWNPVRRKKYIDQPVSEDNDGPDTAYIQPLSSNLTFLTNLVDRAYGYFIDEKTITWTPMETETQLRARLHTYFGLTQRDKSDPKLRVASRGQVYSLRNYEWENEFGPYIPMVPSLKALSSSSSSTEIVPLPSTGELEVDWVQIQAIHHVMATHFIECAASNPMRLEATQISTPAYTRADLELEKDPDFDPSSLPQLDRARTKALDPSSRDWAGVEGVWLISFCFCDHRALMSMYIYLID